MKASRSVYFTPFGLELGGRHTTTELTGEETFPANFHSFFPQELLKLQT